MHHIDPKSKSFTISHARSKSWEAIKEEADKCPLLCANCHRILHNPDSAIKEYASNNYKNDKLSVAKIEDKNLVVYRCECNKVISHGAKSCVDCRSKKREKIQWLDTDELINMVKEIGYSATGRKLGVSGNAVKKRIRNH